MRKESELRRGQLRARDFILRVKRCALFLDMGFGKTAASLTAFLDLLNSFQTTRWLVVAPLRVARDTWPDEIADWEHLNGVKIRAAVGTAAERHAALMDRSASIVTINLENLLWLEKWLKANKQHIRFPFDGIIIDESSKFKEAGTKRWRAARRLSKKVEYIALLTGTPVPETILNIHAQIELLDGGQRLGESFVEFRAEHATPDDYNGYKWTIKPGHEDIIMKKIADICMVPDPEDYIELPPCVVSPAYITLDAASQDKYDELESQYILHIDGGTLEATSAAALTTKLLQLANGCVYETLADETRVEHLIHNAKLKALREIVDESGDVPLLVAYTFKTDVKRIQKEFPQAVVFDAKDKTIKDRWNRREIPMLLISPRSAAHGLNVQRGSNILVYFGMIYSCELWQQLIKRLHRSGQLEDMVWVKPIIVRGTIDEAAYAAVKRKGEKQESFIGSLRDFIKQKQAA